jgi:hypothetical protein
MKNAAKDALTGMLKYFMPESERKALLESLGGEEGNTIAETVMDMCHTIINMPVPYDTEDQIDPIAYLHYFRGGVDAYITERDTMGDQLQAFGKINLGYGTELGYISILELIECGVELDLYFKPVPLSQINFR